MMRLYLVVAWYIGSSVAFTLPAGLRPAKAFGDHSESIVPGKTTTELPLKEPANLSVRSRMLAALNAAPKEAVSETKVDPESLKAEQANLEVSNAAPLLLTKSSQQTNISPVAQSVEAPKPKLEKVPAGSDGKKPSGINFGLNTVLHTNLVDSKGRIMKGVHSVPIKIAPATDLKTAQTRHSASQVESEAEKVVPIKFGSS